MYNRIPNFTEAIAASKNGGQLSEAPELWKGNVLYLTGLQGGGKQLYDLSGHDNHGTLTNMDPATDWVSSPNGGALDFDGNGDYVGVNRFDITMPLTMSMWVNPTSFGDTDGRNTFFDNRITGTDGILFFMENDGSPDEGFVIQTSEGVLRSDSHVMKLNEWQFIAATINFAGNAVLYHNGVSVGANSDFDVCTNITGGNEYRIGRPSAGAVAAGTSLDAFSGLINEPMIFNRALTPAEVQQLYTDPHVMTRLARQPILQPGKSRSLIGGSLAGAT